MKRLTIVTMQLHTPGGIERFVTTLADMFSKDFQVEVIANYGRLTDSLAFQLPNNVKLTFLTPNQPAEISMKKLLASPLKWLKIPAELHRRYKIHHTQNQVFKKYLAPLETDYIITDRAAYNSLVDKYYHGNALKIATDHNYHQNNPHYIKELLHSIKSFDFLVVATNELRDCYASRTHIKCLSIPNPLPDIPTKKSPLTSKNIVSVGRLVPEKDFPLLIDAMRIVHSSNPDIKLTIIGDGVERPYLLSQIKSLNLENTITLTGWLPQTEITKYYYASSLFVMTSKTEAFGLVLTEAMSYGLPCLALSRASGARAQITKDTGILINSPTPQNIASEITRLLTSPSTIRDLQANINRRISMYSIDSVKKLWLQIIQP